MLALPPLRTICVYARRSLWAELLAGNSPEVRSTINNIATEHLGLAEVHRVCAAMNAIWRPTPANDLGIDGQVEFLADGSAVSTGHVLAVQVKSGESYFQNDTTPAPYRPNDRQRAYWTRFPLPVILVLHNPVAAVTLFADVKKQLGVGGAILVDPASFFTPDAREEMVKISEAYSGAFDPAAVATRLKRARLDVGGGRTITAVEFLLASTNLEGGYFELRTARIHPLLEMAQGEHGVSWSQQEYDWILRSTMLCWSLRLVDRFEDDFDHWWYEMGMVPDSLVPLLAQGREVVAFLLHHAAEYVSYEVLGVPEAERAEEVAHALMAICQASSDSHDFSDRLGEHSM